MKICYVVYREDNVMIFDSQVLEYLENLDQKVDFVEPIVFRHEKNLFKKDNIEIKIRKYVKSCKTFSSLPVLIRAQLNINALRLKRYVHKKYALSEQITQYVPKHFLRLEYGFSNVGIFSTAVTMSSVITLLQSGFTLV